MINPMTRTAHVNKPSSIAIAKPSVRFQRVHAQARPRRASLSSTKRRPMPSPIPASTLVWILTSMPATRSVLAFLLLMFYMLLALGVAIWPVAWPVFREFQTLVALIFGFYFGQWVNHFK